MTTSPFQFPTLYSKRLFLRELIPADADRMFEIHGNAETMRLFGNDPMTNPQSATDLIGTLRDARADDTAHLRWALVNRVQPASPLDGTCGLFGWGSSNRTCKVGYELHPGSWGQGLMGEALRCVFAWAFTERDVNRVVAEIHPDNAASRTLAERLGFVKEGVQRQAGFWGDQHHDLVLYSLLRDDFSAVDQ